MDTLIHSRLAFLVATLVGATGVMVWRFQETQRAVTARKIIIPPLGMSTGFFMFVAPQTRIPFTWGLGAFLIGALVFYYPLSRTSKLTRRDDAVYMQRSRAFLWILVGLLAVRLAAHDYVEHLVSPVQTGALFFCLAFGMILRWRVSMYREFRRLQAS
jgi:membrane protein CcdC involved in cytochrome C biogenesis